MANLETELVIRTDESLALSQIIASKLSNLGRDDFEDEIGDLVTLSGLALRLSKEVSEIATRLSDPVIDERGRSWPNAG
jgi:hypothetical protein